MTHFLSAAACFFFSSNKADDCSICSPIRTILLAIAAWCRWLATSAISNLHKTTISNSAADILSIPKYQKSNENACEDNGLAIGNMEKSVQSKQHACLQMYRLQYEQVWSMASKSEIKWEPSPMNQDTEWQTDKTENIFWYVVTYLYPLLHFPWWHLLGHQASDQPRPIRFPWQSGDTWASHFEWTSFLRQYCSLVPLRHLARSVR